MKANISDVVNSHHHRVLRGGNPPGFAHTSCVRIANVASVHIGAEIQGSESVLASQDLFMPMNRRRGKEDMN